MLRQHVRLCEALQIPCDNSVMTRPTHKPINEIANPEMPWARPEIIRVPAPSLPAPSLPLLPIHSFTLPTCRVVL
jgi:hypothetical protein